MVVGVIDSTTLFSFRIVWSTYYCSILCNFSSSSSSSARLFFLLVVVLSPHWRRLRSASQVQSSSLHWRLRGQPFRDGQLLFDFVVTMLHVPSGQTACSPLCFISCLTLLMALWGVCSRRMGLFLYDWRALLRMFPNVRICVTTLCDSFTCTWAFYPFWLYVFTSVCNLLHTIYPMYQCHIREFSRCDGRWLRRRAVRGVCHLSVLLVHGNLVGTRVTWLNWLEGELDWLLGE